MIPSKRITPIPAAALLYLLTSAPHLLAVEAPHQRVLPKIMNTLAADGSKIETRAWIVNLGASQGSYEFQFLSESSGSSTPPQVRTLAAGETLRFGNVLLDLFGLGEGEGVLVVRGNQPFELRGDNSSSSTRIGSLASLELLATESSAHALWLVNQQEGDAPTQTDITAVLAVPNSKVTVSVYDATGLLRGIEVVSSEVPLVWKASASRFLTDPQIPLGRVKFAVTAGSATGYLTLQEGASAHRLVSQSEPILVPSVEGASLLLNGVSQSTAIRLFNPNESAQEIVIDALGFPDNPAISRRIPLAPNELIEISGLIQAEGLVLPDGATGALRLRSDRPFLASGRGLPIAVVYENGFARPGRKVTLLGLNDTSFEPVPGTSIALLSGPNGAKGVLRLRDARGETVTTSPIQLEANQWRSQTIATWFADIEIPGDVRVDIELEAGSVHGYAEIVDVSSNRRVLVAPTAIPTEIPPTPTAQRLVFSELPPSPTSGAPFVVSIRALRKDNSVDTNFKGSVGIRVAGGPGTLQGQLDQNAIDGIATFTGLRLDVAGRYTLSAISSGLESAVSESFDVAQPPPQPAASNIIRVGTFSGQNGYLAQGTLQIERNPAGGETLKFNSNFRVSAGAGAITVWLARSSGPLNTSTSLRVGTINRVFSGEFTFPIPSPGSAGYTHVIVFCDPFRINFGAATLTNR